MTWPVPVPANSCELHRIHSPVPLTFEDHHVIPQAWQQTWAPGALAPARPFELGKGLWDARTVRVFPSCHRSVHFYIVAIMRSLADAGVSGPGQGEAALRPFVDDVRRVYRLTRLSRHAAELETAALAPIRFDAAGGDLGKLIAAGQWGEA